MADQVLALERAARIFTGMPGDRGCVDCAHVVDTSEASNKTLIVDDRGRYWCVEHAVAALGNVRRRVDERTGFTYPWRFEDVGPDGQCAILTPAELAAADEGLHTAAVNYWLTTGARDAIGKVLDRITPVDRLAPEPAQRGVETVNKRST